MTKCTAGHPIPEDADFCPACGAPSSDRRTIKQRRSDRKFRRIVLGALAVLAIGYVAYAVIYTVVWGEDDKSTALEREASNRDYAQYLCEESLKRGADPVGVDFGEYSDALVTGHDGAYVVTDRARVGFDVVSYRCEVTKAGKDDWSVESIDLD